MRMIRKTGSARATIFGKLIFEGSWARSVGDHPKTRGVKMSHRRNMQALARLMPILLISLALCVPGVLRAQQRQDKDPLPSWQGKAKLAILDFVHQITDRSGSKYVSPEERIAAFDDDG